MLSEIGSNFWIDPAEEFTYIQEVTPQSFGLKGNDYCFLSTCRSAISLALELIEMQNPNVSKIAAVPSFTCETVIQPFLDSGYDLKMYEINEELGIEKERFLEDIRESGVGVIIIHRYFGFDTMPDIGEIIDGIRNLGISIIEDRTQCLYSDIELLDADFFVASLRKWHGIPDGGILVCKEGVIDGKPLNVDVELEQAKVDAGHAKYNYLFHHIGEKDSFLEKFRKAEDILDNRSQKYKISPFSYAMQASLDISGMKQKRRRNYAMLTKGIRSVEGIESVFPELQKGVVPLYCPIMVTERQHIQKFLCDRGIYAPIIWPKPDMLPDISGNRSKLYQNMLCIPIDQRYGEEDMDRIVNVLSGVNEYGD